MTYGYVRVSTNMQETSNQRFAIERFCEANGKWIEDDGISGTVDYKKRKLGGMLSRVHKTTYWHNRLTELVVGNDEDTFATLDYIINNASRFAMVAMHFYNIYNEGNPDCVKDTEQAYRVIENLSLKSPSKRFTQEFINRFDPNRSAESEQKC